MFRKFISYYKPHKKLFFLDMTASLAVSLIGICYPVITRNMLNDFIPNQKYRHVIFFGCVMLFLYILKMLLNYFIQYQGHVMGVRMQAQMRSDLFQKLETLPYRYYDNTETGKIMSRMTNDLMSISERAHHGPENIIISSITILISFFYLASINLYLTLIVFVCVPLLIAAASVLLKKMNEAFMESKKSVGEINAALESRIS